jgi:hypothetical protein
LSSQHKRSFNIFGRVVYAVAFVISETLCRRYYLGIVFYE